MGVSLTLKIHRHCLPARKEGIFIATTLATEHTTASHEGARTGNVTWRLLTTIVQVVEVEAAEMVFQI